MPLLFLAKPAVLCSAGQEWIRSSSGASHAPRSAWDITAPHTSQLKLSHVRFQNETLFLTLPFIEQGGGGTSYWNQVNMIYASELTMPCDSLTLCQSHQSGTLSHRCKLINLIQDTRVHVAHTPNSCHKHPYMSCCTLA